MSSIVLKDGREVLLDYTAVLNPRALDFNQKAVSQLRHLLAAGLVGEDVSFDDLGGLAATQALEIFREEVIAAVKSALDS